MKQENEPARVPAAPKGKERFRWLGPGFLWMVSAAGSGELLFSPRVGSMYGYSLLWALFAAVILKLFINREIGRFAVCSGASLIDGFASLPKYQKWILGFIMIPQLLVAVISIAGLAGGAATALALLLPGDIFIWMALSILLSMALVLWGKYKGVEKASVVFASLLALASIVAAISVSPSFTNMAKGMVPSVPENADIEEILPWLGFMMSGAAGLMWYSFWITAKKYGMAGAKKEDRQAAVPDLKKLSRSDQDSLKGWIKVMTLDTTTAVVGTVIITMAFVILGAELLQPKGLVPEENKVAETLGQILGQLWGPVGFWFMVVGVFIGFWDTVLSDQDGHSRLFASGTRHMLGDRLKGKWKEDERLKKFFVVVLVTAMPIALYAAIGNPVQLLKISGAIEAMHIPVVAGLTLYLNRKSLPPSLQPSRGSFVMAVLAALFFAAFAVVYLLQVSGIISLN